MRVSLAMRQGGSAIQGTVRSDIMTAERRGPVLKQVLRCAG